MIRSMKAKTITRRRNPLFISNLTIERAIIRQWRESEYKNENLDEKGERTGEKKNIRRK